MGLDTNEGAVARQRMAVAAARCRKPLRRSIGRGSFVFSIDCCAMAWFVWRLNAGLDVTDVGERRKAELSARKANTRRLEERTLISEAFFTDDLMVSHCNCLAAPLVVDRARAEAAMAWSCCRSDRDPSSAHHVSQCKLH